MNRALVIILYNILAIVSVIFLIISIVRKNRYFAIFFSCSALDTILFAHVLIKLPRTSVVGWLVWITIMFLLTVGVINLFKGLKSNK